MGANADIWDEALGIGNEIKRGSKVIAAGSFSGGNGSMTGGAGNESKTAEAGKIWDRGRNWTSVVLEVVPASVSISTAPGIAGSKVGDMNMHRDVDVDVGVDVGEDEDILQIPVFVRLEYEAQTSSASASTSGSGAGAGSGAASAGSSERKQMGNAGDVGGKSKMEIAYWVVLGIGRVGSGGLDL